MKWVGTYRASRTSAFAILLIAFGSLGTTHIDIFGLYYDPVNNAVEELVFATTFGCDHGGRSRYLHRPGHCRQYQRIQGCA